MPLTIPQYIEVKSAIGDTVACLSPEADALKDCEIDNELNGECTLTFSLPIRKFNNLITTLTLNGVMPTVQVPDSDKWGYLTDQYRIYAGGREFTILGPDAIEVQRDGQKKWGRIKAHESWVELGNHYAESGISNDPQNPTPPVLSVIILSGGAPFSGCTAGSAKSALSYLLQGTGWTVGTVDVEGVHDLETEKISILANIQKVQETWGGILVWDSLNHKVSLRDETLWQNYTGYQIRYAKNLKDITRTDDYGIVTRLYPFGEDDLSIASVNGGIPYLDNFSYTSKVLIGTWENQEIADPQELKDNATKYLATICRPRHNYQVKHVDLRILPGYQHEDFDIGDMVDVVDDELGINIKARVIRYKYDVFHPWQCDLEVGDPVENGADILADSDEIVKYIRGIRNSKGQITAYKLVNESIIAEKIAKSAIDASKINVGLIFLSGDTWTDNIPSPGYISWNQHKLYWNGTEYIITAGNTNQKYIYWDNQTTTYNTSATLPDLTDAGFIIAVNNGGLHELVWRQAVAKKLVGEEMLGDGAVTPTKIANAAVGSAAIAEAAILSAHIAEAAILSAHIGAAQILDAHIANLNANKINVTDLTALTSNDGFSRMVGTGFETYDPSGNLMVKQGGYQTLGDQTATFSRSSVAYKSDGTQVAANVPRFEAGKFGQAIMVEEGTTNLVTNPGFEDGSTGWTLSSTGSVVNGGYSGNKALRVYSASAVNARERQPITVSIAVGEAIAISIKYKVLSAVTATLSPQIYILGTGADGTTYDPLSYSVLSDLAVDGKWKTKTMTWSNNKGQELTSITVYPCLANGFIGEILIDNVQVEKKAYPTSFTATTRSSETLTIPTAGVLNEAEGDIEIYAYEDGVNRYGYLWDTHDGTKQSFLCYKTLAGKYQVWFNCALALSTSIPSVGYHRISVKWQGVNVAILIDGVERATAVLPSAVSFAGITDIKLGSGYDLKYQWNQPIDDLRISNIARSDEEILAAYQSNQPLPVDEYTTWKSSFDGTLAQTVAQYGLYSESGTLIGQVIKGSEIYGTSIRTGLPDDSDYIELKGDEFFPFTIYKNKKPGVELYAVSDGGYIRILNPNRDTAVGWLAGYDDPMGYGLLLESLSGSGYLPLIIEGSSVTIYANPRVDILHHDMGSSKADVTVWGDLHVTGQLSCSGEKPAIQETESYGRRAIYARESPELKFIDEGLSQLINGEAKIDLDPIFLETIELHTESTPWLVLLTPYGNTPLYVAELGENYLIIREQNGGTSNTSFAWSLSAFRKGFAHMRMENFDTDGDILTSGWEDELLSEVDSDETSKGT